MILDKVLLLKGLGGLSACAGLGCGAAYIVKHYISKTNEKELAELISKVGLDCKTPSATGTECTKVTTPADKKININQGGDNGKFEIDTLPTGSGKIKLYKLEGDNTGYHKGLKFVIEDGDITKDSKKLEQFETYEIEEVDESGTKKYYLKRKFTKSVAIKNDLGLPDGCTLPNGTSSTCNNVSLDSQKLNNLNFKGKVSSSLGSGASLTLSITKETTDTNIFTDGYKFSLQATGGTVTITTKTKTITIASGKNIEFKINKEGNSLTLEKAWDITKWGQKVGLTNCNATEKTCDLPNSSLNVEFSSNDKGSKTIKSESQSKKLKYEENAAGHNQGFKFYAEQDIELNGDNSGKKIEKKGDNGSTYEIKKVESEWYLAKKI